MIILCIILAFFLFYFILVFIFKFNPVFSFIQSFFPLEQPSLGIACSESALLFAILSPVGAYFSSGFQPVTLMADPKYTRAFPGGCGDRKMGSNYAPTIHVQV